jgi:hypothetical protein
MLSSELLLGEPGTPYTLKLSEDLHNSH